MFVDKLMQKLHHPEPLERMNAVRFLGELEHLPGLIKALNDEHADIRIYAVEKITGLSESPVPELIKEFESCNENGKFHVIVIFEKLGDERAIPLLVKLLGVDDELRKKAVWALGNMNAADQLLDVLKNGDVLSRRAAAVALGSSGNEVDFQALNFIYDKDPEVRSNAAWALGYMCKPAACKYLVDMLRDDDQRVRENAAEALLRIESEHPGSVDYGAARDAIISTNGCPEDLLSISKAAGLGKKKFQIPTRKKKDQKLFRVMGRA